MSGNETDPPAWQLASLPDDLEVAGAELFCRQVASSHYENFTVATSLVPAELGKILQMYIHLCDGVMTLLMSQMEMQQMH